MFKALIREVTRSLLGPARTKPPAADPQRGEHENIQSLFSAADGAKRAQMLAELKQRLHGTTGTIEERTRLGDWLLQTGTPLEAERAYREALKLGPQHARAQEGLGLALMQLGRLDEAYLHLETANKADPGNAEILTHWGLVELELGNLSKAASKFEKAVERDPSNAHAWHNLGLVALKQGQTALSLQYLEKAIALRPQHGLAHSNLALAYRQVDRLEEALTAAKRATELKLGNARVWVVLADLLINAGRFREAEEALEKAEAVEPGTPPTVIALGKLYTAWGRPRQARESYLKALSINPGNPEAESGLGQLELLLGQWAPGWQHYEARVHTENSPIRRFSTPTWDGRAPLTGPLLIHAEQGLGDIILFASCLPDLLSRVEGPCHVEAPPRLAELLARSFPQAHVISHEPASADSTWLDRLGPINMQLPIGSLPRWFRSQASDFPPRAGYLQADPQKVAAWRDQLAALPRPLIGITWRGGLITTASLQRSLELGDLARALQPLGGTLVCLQHGAVDEEVHALALTQSGNVATGLSGFADLDDLAALTKAVDVVVTVCSTQAHLTGALGHPGIVLVPANPNWRYGAEGPSMPWYPSLQLVRQDTLGDWSAPLSTLVERVSMMLTQDADSQTSTNHP